MKKSVIYSALVALSLGISGTALAAGSNTLTVTAAITGTCAFSTATSTLAFGALDATSASNATASTTLNFWCTKGTVLPAIIADNGLNYSGSRRLKSAANPTELIPYSLTLTPAGTTGLGKTSMIVLNIAGTILNADYVDAKVAADYSDTVTIPILP